MSIAAIRYWVISLLSYAAKALKHTALSFHPDVLVGLAVPFVLWGVWHVTRRIQRALHKGNKAD